MTTKIYTPLELPPAKPTINKMPSRTVQSFGNEVNINQIMARAQKRQTVFINPGQPLWGQDVSNALSFHETLNRIAEIKDQFMSLSPHLRDYFDNDPGKMLEFIEDPKNEAEGRKIGLYNPLPEEPLPVKVEVINQKEGAKA